MTARRYRALLGGAPVAAVVTADGLDLGGRLVPWLEVDDVIEGDHAVSLVMADATLIELRGLGTTHDALMAELRAARGLVRRAALTLATGAPLVSFLSRDPSGLADVHVFAKTLIIEPRTGQCTPIPLPLVEHVEREGYAITLVLRGLPPVVVRALGARTDEFLLRLEQARRDLQSATMAAYAAHDPALAGFAAPDGWAMAPADGGPLWPALHAVAIAAERGDRVAMLEEIAGERLSLGLYTDGGTGAMVFALAPVGTRVAVEAADVEDRATFVFEAPDVARLNAVLLLTSFRREALSLPDDQLGRWAVAARVSPFVQEARGALVARIVHDAGWERNVRQALTG